MGHRGSLNRLQNWTYTPEGFVSSHTDANRNTWLSTPDAMGRVVAETDPASRLTTHSYDQVGNLRSTTRPLGLGPHLGLRHRRPVVLIDR